MNEDNLRKLQQLVAQVQKSIEPLRAMAEWQRQWQRQMKPQLDALGEVQKSMEPSMRAMAEWQRQWQRQIGELGRIQLPGQMIEDLRKFQDWFSAHQAEIAAALQALRTGLRRALSDNLHSLEAEVAIAAFELMSKDDGVVVVWLPPAEVVGQLVDADTMAARDAVLVARGAEIAAAATEILGHVDSPRLQPLTSTLAEAWAVCDRTRVRTVRPSRRIEPGSPPS